jgi:phage recombination protein Bet
VSGELVVAATSGDLTPERIELVRRTVAKGASDDELAMLFSLAERYELDPFAKEIWCIVPFERDGKTRKTQKNGEPVPPQITASRDGFLAIANRHTQFDGMDSDVVCEGDSFQPKRDEAGRVIGVDHVYGEKRGKPRAGYALVWRTDRSRPSYFYAKWGEYGEPNAFFVNDDGSKKANHYSPWYRYPSAMILKVAEAMALKRAFSLSGLTAEEELHAGQSIDEGAEGSLPERQALHTPKISPASRGLGVGRAHSRPASQETPEPELPPAPPEEAYAEPEPDPSPDDEIPFGENLELPEVPDE